MGASVFRLLDDVVLSVVLGAALGLVWFVALFRVVRAPGDSFSRGLSRRAWLAILVCTGFLGAFAWFGRGLLRRR